MEEMSTATLSHFLLDKDGRARIMLLSMVHDNELAM
jgi:hypothetical protein